MRKKTTAEESRLDDAFEGELLRAPTPVQTDGEMSNDRTLVLLDTCDEVTVQAGEEGMRFLFASGKPLREPVAWQGPIVMNTQEGLRQAFSNLERGTFLDP